jgi:hypothetical protein
MQYGQREKSWGIAFLIFNIFLDTSFDDEIGEKLLELF